MSTAVCRAAAIALTGLRGTPVIVEAAVSNQLPGMAIIGLPDAALAEAKQRVRLAAQQAGMPLSDRFIIVNLSPAALPKQGSSFDLAIALSAIAASGHLPVDRLTTTAHLGELSLDGELRRSAGLLSAVLSAKGIGFSTVMVPAGCAREAALVPGIEVIAVHDLAGAVAWHRGEAGNWWIAGEQENLESAAQVSVASSSALHLPAGIPSRELGAPDMSDIVGQPEAVDALVIAAAGRHHLSMIGPPGAGKTLLATRLPTILPDLSPDESIIASSIASLGDAGITELVRRPPFESPHHTASKISIIGGGQGGIVQPGAITNASYGVLFLDEAPEFPAQVLDAMRQPLESGLIEIHRARVRATLPAKVQLVLAMNPCPCGNANSLDPASPCRCSPSARVRYLNRLSGPLTDRIDLRLSVHRVSSVLLDDAVDEHPRPSSAELRKQVLDARARMAARLRNTPWRVNAELPGTFLRAPAHRLSREVTEVIDRALDRGSITMRGYDRTLRVGWTIADLAGKDSPGRGEIAHALALRGGAAP